MRDKFKLYNSHTVNGTLVTQSLQIRDIGGASGNSGVRDGYYNDLARDAFLKYCEFIPPDQGRDIDTIDTRNK